MTSALILLLVVPGTWSSLTSNAEAQTPSRETNVSPSPVTRSIPPGLKSEPQAESSWFGSPYVVVSAIVLVLALIAVAGAALFIQASRLSERIDELEVRHLKTNRASRKDTGRDLHFVRNSFERLTDFEHRLSETENQLHGWIRDMRSSQVATSDVQIYELSRPYVPCLEESVLRFPVAVEECLASLREKDIETLSVTSLGGHLIEAEKGEFLLIMGSSFERPLLIIPKVVRFITKQDYYNSFAEFYHCDKVTSGEVWIIDPTVANRIQDGWSLGKKGRLEIR